MAQAHAQRPVPTNSWKNKSFDYLSKMIGTEEAERLRQNEFPPLPCPMFVANKEHLALKQSAVKSLFFESSLRTGRRSSNTSGVAGVGTATIVAEPQFPNHEFFSPGRVYPLRLRHSNATTLDDRSLDIRGVALKFADVDEGGPLDLVFFSGEGLVFFNGPALDDFVAGPLTGDVDKYKAYLQKNSRYYYNLISLMRRAPSSFSQVHYYAQLTYKFRGDDGVMRHCRYRVVPGNDVPESGLPDAADQAEPWNNGPRPGDDRSPNYLKQEFVKQLEKTSIEYRLQIQIRDRRPDDTNDVYNPALPWDASTYPWLDLADIRVTQPLHPEVAEGLRYGHDNQPASLRLADEAESVFDYRSICVMRSAAFAGSYGGRTLYREIVRKGIDSSVYADGVEMDADTPYGIGIYGCKPDGCLAGVTAQVTIMGESKRSEPIDVTLILACGYDQEMQCMVRDVGEPVALKLSLTGGDVACYIDKIVVTKDGVKTSFVCKQLVQNDVILSSGTASLANQDNEQLKAARTSETCRWQQLLSWQRDVGMPASAALKGYDSLPKALQLDPRQKFVVENPISTGMSRLLIEQYQGKQKTLGSFQECRQMLRVKIGFADVIAEHFQNDREYGRQFLQGAHPLAVFRVGSDGLPAKFPVDDFTVKATIGSTTTLANEINAGRIFMVDYPLLDGIPPSSSATLRKRYVTPAMGLFWQTGGDAFVPIAIQLKQTPNRLNPIFTPQDNATDWLYAKMWLKCADSQYHQVVSRLLNNHFVLEPIAMALYRNVPSLHPIYKLLEPYVRSLIGLNLVTKTSLASSLGKVLGIGKEGIETLLKKAYKEFDFRHLIVPHSFTQRGTADLPGYLYRDDALLVWHALRNFVRDVVAAYYPGDGEVRADAEIQAFVREIHDVGLPYDPTKGERRHNVPSTFVTVDELVSFVTAIVFAATGQQAALSGGQLDAYGFCPNAPMAMFRPPPERKGIVDMKLVLNSLGDMDAISGQAALAFSLTQIDKDDVCLGRVSVESFNDARVAVAADRFKDRLIEIECQIGERNAGLVLPYPYLLPSKIPSGICV